MAVLGQFQKEIIILFHSYIYPLQFSFFYWVKLMKTIRKVKTKHTHHPINHRFYTYISIIQKQEDQTYRFSKKFYQSVPVGLTNTSVRWAGALFENPLGHLHPVYLTMCCRFLLGNETTPAAAADTMRVNVVRSFLSPS